MIKAVCFDFFGVVCSDGYWEFTSSQKQADSVFNAYAQQVNLGQIHWQNFVAKVAEATGKSVAEVNKMYQSEQLNPQVVGLIEQLHSKYKTALITNAHHEFLEPLLQKTHLYQVFDTVVISSKVGSVKPSQDIFKTALDNLGVKSEEAVFIDDIDQHVRGAETVGMKAIQYTSFNQMQAELDKIIGSS